MSTKNISIDGLSKNIQEVITAYSDVFQCPREYIVGAVFQAAAATVGNRVIVDSGKYKNMLVLWMAVIGDSGTNKSAPIQAILEPLKVRDQEMFQKYKDALKAYREAVKDGNVSEYPICAHTIIKDHTLEACYQSLANGNSLLLYSDELYTHFSGGDRYGGNARNVRSHELSLWSGESIRVDRKGQDSLFIDSAFLSMLGGIQPYLVAESFGHKALIGSGYPQRWLWLYPDKPKLPKYSTSILSGEIIDQWFECIGFLNYCTQEKRTLTLSDGAQKVYIDIYDVLQDDVALYAEDGKNFLAETMKKFQINVLRLAGIAHLLGEKPSSNVIQEETMMYAWKLLGYFQQTAVKVYDLFKRYQKPLEEIRNKELTKEFLRRITDNNRKCYKDGSFEFNQSEFANACGCSQQYVSKLMNELMNEL